MRHLHYIFYGENGLTKACIESKCTFKGCSTLKFFWILKNLKLLQLVSYFFIKNIINSGLSSAQFPKDNVVCQSWTQERRCRRSLHYSKRT